MKELTDQRRAQGKRYSLALILTCVLLAKMAGETTLQASWLLSSCSLLWLRSK